jgi:hypothetical protein
MKSNGSLALSCALRGKRVLFALTHQLGLWPVLRARPELGYFIGHLCCSSSREIVA